MTLRMRRTACTKKNAGYSKSAPRFFRVFYLRKGVIRFRGSAYPAWYKDPFVNEICEFYDCIASSRKPKTSLQDSLEDLELFQKIIETLKKSESV